MKNSIKKLALLAALTTVIGLFGFVKSADAATQHTVLFMYGTKSNVQLVAHGANAVIPLDIDVPGYIFKGWVGNPNCVTEDRIILGDYYVKNAQQLWTATPTHAVPTSSYPVSNYGLDVRKQEPTVKFNNNITAPEPEWWKDLNIPRGVPGVTCAVHWMNGWTGELWRTDVIPYGATCPDPGNPCISGFEFIGWEGSWENVTEDRVIKAWYFKKADISGTSGHE